MTLNAISHDITAWTMMIHQRMLSRIERISRNMKYKARSPAERSMASVLAVNERARTPGGENFEQHRVRNASVEDDRRLDPRIDRRDAGLDLRNHPARDRAVAFQSVARLAVETGEQQIGRAHVRTPVTNAHTVSR